jgi:hypothetical protein
MITANRRAPYRRVVAAGIRASSVELRHSSRHLYRHLRAPLNYLALTVSAIASVTRISMT